MSIYTKFGFNLFLQDHILIELSQGGLKGSESKGTEEEAVLVVNPNTVHVCLFHSETPFQIHGFSQFLFETSKKTSK